MHKVKKKQFLLNKKVFSSFTQLTDQLRLGSYSGVFFFYFVAEGNKNIIFFYFVTTLTFNLKRFTSNKHLSVTLKSKFVGNTTLPPQTYQLISIIKRREKPKNNKCIFILLI